MKLRSEIEEQARTICVCRLKSYTMGWDSGHVYRWSEERDQQLLRSRAEAQA